MQCFTKRNLLHIIACIVLMLSSGCASRQDKADPVRSDADGELLVTGKGICQEVRSGKMWQASKSGLFSSLQEAERYAASLNLGGYNDWRLSTKEELFDLYYIFFWEKNGDCAMNRNGNFWAVSVDGSPSLGHWETYFLCNPEFRYIKSQGTRGYVRAVRP